MTPVILLSDGYIANGAEPWRFPKAEDIPAIDIQFKKPIEEDETYLPYFRDEKLVREWALPGTKGLAHRLGGLEKEANTGNVSYDPANHEYMIKTREAKVEMIADYIPEQKITMGVEEGDLLLLGWGSTFGVMESITKELAADGLKLGHSHLRYIRPFPKNLGEILKNYKKVMIPEINNGQLSKIIRERFLIEPIEFNKIQGVPIMKAELRYAIKEVLENM